MAGLRPGPQRPRGAQQQKIPGARELFSIKKGSPSAARVAYLAGWDAAGAEKLARDLLPRAWTRELQAQLASLLLARGETTEAFALLRMASQLEPDSIAVHHTLVQACAATASHGNSLCDRSARR